MMELAREGLLPKGLRRLHFLFILFRNITIFIVDGFVWLVI